MAGQPITLTIPAVGTAGPTYASQINTALSALEVELERKVVPADITINANLSFLSSATNYAATDLKYTKFALQSEATLTAAGFPMSLFAGSSDGELYFNDNAGRQIQITTNGVVNVSTTGGINGTGYGATGVEIRWDSGDGEYELRTGSGTNDYADVRIDDVYLSDGSSNFIRLTAPALMSADYALTLPGANPSGATKLLKATTAGLLDYTGAATHDGNLTQTGTLAVSGATTLSSTLAVTSNATVGGTLGVTGATTLAAATLSGIATFNNDVVVATGHTLDLQGTSHIKHGNRYLVIPGCAFLPLTSLKTVIRSAGFVQAGEADVILYAPLLLDAGVTVTNIHWYVYNDVGANTREWGVYRSAIASETETAIENDTDGTSATALDFSNSTSFTTTEANRYYLRAYLRYGAALDGDKIYSCVVSYERQI
jgi:hypothetical protein